jgi:hypothetical protein
MMAHGNSGAWHHETFRRIANGRTVGQRIVAENSNAVIDYLSTESKSFLFVPPLEEVHS